MQGHVRNISDHPTVMRGRRNVKYRARQQIEARAVWQRNAQGRLERITDHIQSRYIDPGKIVGGQVTVSRHGSVGYFRSFGEMDRERAKPVSTGADLLEFEVVMDVRPAAD